MGDLSRLDPEKRSLLDRALDFFGVVPILGVMILLITFTRADLFSALVRPLAMRYGKPATALVTAKWRSNTRGGGSYVQLNYEYSKDYAPRPDIRVAPEAFAAIVENSRVAIHFLPGCASCVALDEDFGSARRQATNALVMAAILAGAALLSVLFRRRREDPLDGLR